MKTVSVILALLAANSLVTAQATRPQADLAAQRQAEYERLARSIFHTTDRPDSGRLYADPAKEAETRKKLLELINGEVLARLNGQRPSDGAVASAIRSLQGEELTTYSGKATPWAKQFDLNGRHWTAVAFTLAEGVDAYSDTHAYLNIYEETGGRWSPFAQVPTLADFRQATYAVAQMDSGKPGEAWFLAWGTTIGDSGARLRIRLYSFDGQTPQTIWKRDGLSGGTMINVTPGSVTFEYYKVYKGDEIVRRKLHVGPSGLE